LLAIAHASAIATQERGFAHCIGLDHRHFALGNRMAPA
jgi:hypothetical protein